MIKMAIEDAVNYIVKGDELAYNEDLFAKMEDFIFNLPHNPKEIMRTYIGEDELVNIIVKDYEEERYYEICFGVINDKITVRVVGNGYLSASSSRVNSNKEALEMLNQYQKLKYADDLEPAWYMSNDSKLIDWGNRFNEQSDSIKKSIFSML